MRLLAAVLVIALPVVASADGFFTLKGHGGPIMGIAVAPDGQIATASFDNSVGLWTGPQPHWFEGHAAAVNTVAFGGNHLFSAGDDFTIRRWPDGQIIGRHNGKVTALAVLPGLVASASWDGSIGLWPLDGAQGRFLNGHRAGVNDIVATADGKRLYSASTDGTLRLWNIETGAELRQILSHGFGINELSLNETAGWLAYGANDGVTRLVHPETGAQIADFTLDRRPILALVQNPGGTLLAVGDGEGYIMIIDTVNMEIARDFRATLTGPVWALAFSPDGSNIHAGGLDDAMYSWPLESLDKHGQMQAREGGLVKDPDDMENGERLFVRRCSICHTLTPDSARRAGPTLYGIFGRPAGTLGGYAYSKILDGSEIVWNETTIDRLFDIGPDHYIPGSKMPMQQITDPRDRTDLVDFLRRATARN